MGQDPNSHRRGGTGTNSGDRVGTNGEHEPGDSGENEGRVMGNRRRLNIWREVFELAGELSIDPGPFTLHELYTMLWGKRRAVRDETALLISAVLAPHRPKGSQPIKPESFNPYREKIKRVDEWADITALKALLPRGTENGNDSGTNGPQ